MSTSLVSKIKNQQKQQKISEAQKVLDDSRNISSMSAEEKENIIYLTDDMLLDDPGNAEAYGDYNVEGLVYDMKRDGFQGVIYAYPWKGKYMIQAGHRRRHAAKEAGIEKYPVYITETPIADWDRVIKLHKFNNHDRGHDDPLVTARVADQLYKAHKEKNAYMKKKAKENGEIYEEEKPKDLVAKDLEISVPQLYRYLALLNVSDELRSIVEENKFSWSSISEASTLSEEDQHNLYVWLKGFIAKGEWMDVRASDIDKYVKMLKNKAEKKEIPEEEPKTARVRRIDGTKAINKNSMALKKVLNASAIYNPDDIPETINVLSELKEEIDKKIEELSKM